MKGINDIMGSMQKLQIMLGLKKPGYEQHSKPTLLSNFILGCQDGLVNVLGIILGVSAAGSDIRIIFVAGLAALVAESISMGAVAYTSTDARRMHYLKEVAREKHEIATIPQVERNEVRVIFKNWGYDGKELEDATDKIVSNPKAWLEFMMAHELSLAPVKTNEPFTSFLVVGASSVAGSFVPLIPFFFTGGNISLGVQASVAISALTLFIIGVYEAKKTVGSLWKNGLQLTVIGLAAGLAGYLVGRVLGARPI